MDGVTRSIASPSPGLAVTLNSMSLVPGGNVTHTVTDGHAGTTLLPGLWYTIPITGVSGGFAQTAGVRLLVGSARIYLPVICR